MADSSHSDGQRCSRSWRGKSILKIFRKSKKQTIKKELEQLKADQLYMENSFYISRKDLDKLVEDNRRLQKSMESIKERLKEIEDSFNKLLPGVLPKHSSLKDKERIIPPAQMRLLERLRDHTSPKEQKTETNAKNETQSGATIEGQGDIENKFESLYTDCEQHSSTMSEYDFPKRPCAKNENELTSSSEPQCYKPGLSDNRQNDIEDIRQHNLSNVRAGGNGSDFINVY